MFNTYGHNLVCLNCSNWLKCTCSWPRDCFEHPACALVKYKQILATDRDCHIVIESDAFTAGNRISPVESVAVKSIVWCERVAARRTRTAPSWPGRNERPAVTSATRYHHSTWFPPIVCQFFASLRQCQTHAWPVQRKEETTCTLDGLIN